MSFSEPLDLRLVPAALAAWTAAALAIGWSPGRTLAAAGALWAAGVLGAARRHDASGSRWQASLLMLMVAGAALASIGLRVDAVSAGPIPALASEGASVGVEAAVTGDPALKHGTFSSYVVLPVRVTEVTSRGRATSVSSPVLVIGNKSWLRVSFGERLKAYGRLQEADGPDLSGVLIASGAPRVTASAGFLNRRISSLRAALREAADPLPAPQRGLLPALVDGDRSGIPDQTTADFKATGLTHLLAVSGSNLTLVLGFVLFLARGARIGGYSRAVVGAAAVGFFVLLARPEPSVLRAAAMGLVGLAGLATGSRARGLRALCLAVTVLIVVDPWLARSAGFVLSTVATAAIVVLSPRWRDCLARWMPRWLAEAIAVPLAAQVACTPVVAALSGQVSVVGVLANLAVAPAVGPATVVSLLAGLVAMLGTSVGHLVGRVAGLPLWWIVTVASSTSRPAGASLAWGEGAASIAALGAVCLGATLVMPLVLSRRVAFLGASGALVVAVLHPIHVGAWPPSGWVMVMCDVGQGDGLVLNAGGGSVVVVDTGPDPAAMTACLSAVHAQRVALLVLTHFHADHVDGMSGVVGRWPVAEIETSPLLEPVDRYREVMSLAASNGVPVTTAAVGERRRIGQLRWRVLGPPAQTAHDSGMEGSAPNNASVVMLLRVAGVRILLAGDAETAEDDAMLADGGNLRVDVLKEPHHGSAALDPRFLAATHARVSLISVGADNVYGHPAPQTLAWLQRLGMSVYRTDQHGDIALVVHDGTPSIVTSR